MNYKCRECKKKYTPKIKTESFFCSRNCKDKNRKKKDRAERIASKFERICAGCEKIIPKNSRVDKKWCSEECSSKARGHTMNAQRRIRTSDGIESFKRNDIYERDAWICQLCKKSVNPKLTFPNPSCASLDHVVPLSRGGSHRAMNVQLAHLRCNTSRGNKVENLSPRPALILNQKEVFSPTEAAKLIGVSKSVLIWSIQTSKIPFIQDGKFGTRYLSKEVVAELILTGVPGSLQWRKEQPKKAIEKTRSSNCKNCGKLFQLGTEKRKYCSRSCTKESANLRRRKRPVEIRCSVCSKEIPNREQEKKVNLCSTMCTNQHRRNMRGKQAEEKFAVCPVCKGHFPVAGKSGRPTVTCSSECAVELPRLRSRQWYSAKGKSRLKK